METSIIPSTEVNQKKGEKQNRFTGIIANLKETLGIGSRSLEPSKNLESSLPSVENLNTLSYLEVLALTKAEPGLELYPLDIYQGTIKGSLTYKGELPMMKRVSTIQTGTSRDNHGIHNLERENGLEQKFNAQGYISDNELETLRKTGYKVNVYDTSALFIIAPSEMKNTTSIETPEVKKDPIILVRFSENKWLPVHAWDHSKALAQQLAALN